MRLFRFRTLPASRKTSFSCPLIRPWDSHFAVNAASSTRNPQRSAQSRRASRSACLISAMIDGDSLAVSERPGRRTSRATLAASLSARSRVASYACCKLGERRSGIGSAPWQDTSGRRFFRQGTRLAFGGTLHFGMRRRRGSALRDRLETPRRRGGGAPASQVRFGHGRC